MLTLAHQSLTDTKKGPHNCDPSVIRPSVGHLIDHFVILVSGMTFDPHKPYLSISGHFSIFGYKVGVLGFRCYPGGSLESADAVLRVCVYGNGESRPYRGNRTYYRHHFHTIIGGAHKTFGRSFHLNSIFEYDISSSTFSMRRKVVA